VAAVLVIAFAAVLGLAIGIAGFRAVRSAQVEQTPRVAHLGELGERVESFVGGARWPWGNATYPLARLDFHQYGIRVHGAVGLLDRVVPDWQSRYPDIAGAEPVGAAARLGAGLRLRSAAPNSWIIFWTAGRVEELVARLASVGVPATVERRKISFWTGRDV
jgi:hypothetical protein